jgi:hypothetical protein
MSLVPSIANELVDGIGSWKIKNIDDSDAAYHALPIIKNGKLKLTSFKTEDKTKQTVPISYLLEASAEIMPIRTTANLIKLLPLFSTKKIEHKIALIDGGRIISSAPSTSTPSPTSFGAIKWKLVSDKDMDGEMLLEVSIKRKLTKTEYGQILTSANTPADGTDPGTDAFHLIDSLTEADIVPAGIAKIELGAAGAGTYLDDIENFRKGIFTAELMCSEDGRGMYRNGAIHISLDAEGLETSEAEVLKWNAIQFRKNEARITFTNGMVCTLPNTANDGLGIATDLLVEKDMDDLTVLKVTGAGRILTSQWNACFGA